MLSNEQLERYSRHIILKEVGAKGQKKLLNAKVLIIGAGGLGAPAAMYLAAAGVGTIGIADADEVDLSNLQRQIIHSTQDVGKAKVQSAKETMEAINPDVKVITYRTFVDSESIMDLIKDYDFIIDGTDNFPAKFLINDACVMAKKPTVITTSCSVAITAPRELPPLPPRLPSNNARWMRHAVPSVACSTAGRVMLASLTMLSLNSTSSSRAMPPPFPSIGPVLPMKRVRSIRMSASAVSTLRGVV